MALINRYMISGLMLKNLEETSRGAEGQRRQGDKGELLNKSFPCLPPLPCLPCLFSMPHAPCPMPHAPCPMPHAPCPIPHSPFPIPHSLLSPVELLPVATSFLIHSNCNQKGDGQQPPPFFLIAGQSVDLCLVKRCWGQDYANALAE